MRKAALAGSILLLSAVAGALLLRCGRIPDFEQVRGEYRPSDLLLLDRNGRLLEEIRVSREGRRLQWVDLEQVPPTLIESVIRAEDQHFRKHNGIDWPALASAGLDWLSGGRRRGASTISMQVAGMVTDEGLTSSRRSVLQKATQILSALRLERRWSKTQILEAYLNLVSFRGELQGIGAAARGIFDKDPHGLTPGEAVVLACLIRSPNAPAEQVLARSGRLLKALEPLVPERVLEESVRRLERANSIPKRWNWAPHVARALVPPGVSGRSMRSSLDRELQIRVMLLIQEKLIELRERNVRDAAALVVDHRSGEVLAYAGNGGTLSSAVHVDGVRARRQAGSTLKPFLYAVAFEDRLLTPLSLIEDSPIELDVVGGLYRPGNYDHRFRGPVTARVALASSLNIPAVRVLELVGVEWFIRRLRAFGFGSLGTADFYGPSLALGSADVTLWELVSGYSALARGGEAVELRLEPGPPMPRGRAVSPQAAYLVGDILSDRESRSSTFDLESPLSTPFWTAVKTGTSKDMRDNWCLGYSARYTVGVWVGNFSGEPMWNVSGISGAAPLWEQIMSGLHRQEPSVPPDPPPGVVRRTVETPSLISAIDEWFMEGTVPHVTRLVESRRKTRIEYPEDGTVFALDPDIPDDLERIYFETAGPLEGFTWRLDGRWLGSAERDVGWHPLAGRHSLDLLDRLGNEVDSITFFVRGGEESESHPEGGHRLLESIQPSRPPSE